MARDVNYGFKENVHIDEFSINKTKINSVKDSWQLVIYSTSYLYYILNNDSNIPDEHFRHPLGRGVIGFLKLGGK